MAAISKEARIWAVKELSRRAGVSREFFDSWTIDVPTDATIIHLRPGTAKQICFRNLPVEKDDKLAGPSFHTVRAGWLRSPAEPVRSAISDLIVPFCDEEENGRRSLFRRVSADQIECFADLPASTFFSLCRVEETQREGAKDSRFMAAMSVAARDGFLCRPVVDEWGLALAQAIETLVPGWQPKARSLRAKISHDIDEVESRKKLWQGHRTGETKRWVRVAWMVLPFDLRYGIKLCTDKRRIGRGCTQLVRTFVSAQPSCGSLIESITNAVRRHRLTSAVYWKASPLGPYDSGYDPRDAKIRNVIHKLQEQGVENGFHPGYHTFCRPDLLQAELDILRSVLDERELGGRQHYLRWCPETWADWENAGLSYDSTVGYADHCGFRAGTCIPYRPWLVSQNREARLLEIPLLAMDTTLLDYMRLRGDALLNLVRELLIRCRMVGGVFTFLCHNTTLRDAHFADVFEQILEMLGSCKQFDWKSCLENEWA